MDGRVLVFEPDLLFSSQIESAAHKLGLDAKVTVNMSELKQTLQDTAPRAVLVNLDALGADSRALVGLVPGACRLIGYYSHVNSKLATEALADGFELVLPRRAFVDRLNDILGVTHSGGELSHCS
jgi:hypothetical protein